MTYHNAVRILGKDEPAIITALDQALGLSIIAATAFSPASALPYFDLKSELINQLTKLTAKIGEKIRGAQRIEYEDLVAAAHAVITMTAFTEVLLESLRRVDIGKEKEWERQLRKWKPSVGAKAQPTAFNRTQFVEWATHSVLLPPGPTRPFERVQRELLRVYRSLGSRALEYLQEIQRWNDLTLDRQEEIESILTSSVPRQALQRYQELFARLAAEVPEFMAWVLLGEHAATRTVVQQLINSSKDDSRETATAFRETLERFRETLNAHETALGDLPTVLREMGQILTACAPDVRQAVHDYHLIHQAILEKPLLAPRLSGDLADLQFPSNRRGYINPNFRLALTTQSDQGGLLAQEHWWRDKPVREDLGGFMAGYLRSGQASRSPLLVLGDPGSGKSLLAKVLAAQLPPAEFAVLRVELRHVRSSQEIADQVDMEVRRQTNARYGLADLTDKRGAVTRIVIMDGLDELLQLSTHEGLGFYLERLMDFQDTEFLLGSPVIAIVTARTIVMDRIAVPSRSTVVKLEGFTRLQIDRWLNLWNEQNAQYFSEHDLRELTPEVIERQLDLAAQPLLLALLALYDAEGNALRNAANLSQAELYERLFRSYLERELAKGDWPTRKAAQHQLIEERFRELSTIAMGMINRGGRFITRQELEKDLINIGIRRTESTGRTKVTTTDDAVGQFFFLYRARAQDGDHAVSEGYEFVHATFGEFLAARVIAHQLADAADIVKRAEPWNRSEAERHALSLLAPFLASRPLVTEEQVLLFLEDVVGQLVSDRHNAGLAIAVHVPALMRSGIAEVQGRSSVSGSQLQDVATLSLNLVLACMRVSDGSMPLSAFNGEGEDIWISWRRMLALWKSYVPIDDWDHVLASFSVRVDGVPRLCQRSGNVQDLISGLIEEIRSPIVRRLAREGQLMFDVQLTGASSLWACALASLPDLYHEDDSVDALMAGAFFRMSPVPDDPTVLQAALAVLGAEDRRPEDLLDVIVTGPITWRTDVLRSVGNYLLAARINPSSATSLLRLIVAMDSRGEIGLARKLVHLIPPYLGRSDVSSADIALVVFLSRRHQVPALLSRCVSVNALSGQVIDWLSIDDIAWIFECKAFSSRELDRLRTRLLADVRFRRAAEKAIQFIRDLPVEP